MSENLKDTFFTSEMFVSKKSPFKKYRELVAGRAGFFYFLKYELVIFLFGGLPGLLGLVLRSIFYRWLFKKIGRGVVFGRNMTIRQPQKIEIGDGVIFDDNSVMDAKSEAKTALKIGHNCFVGRNSIISCKGGQIEIGQLVNIGINCLIHSDKKVAIGDNCLIASYAYIVGGGLYKAERTDIPIREQGQIYREIFIEEDVWIGAGAKVLSGVTVGRSSIIGAGAVVTRDIPAYSVALGIPAEVVKSRK